MKKTILGITIGFSISLFFAFTIANYELKNNTAEVEQVQGYLIFAKSKPVKDYEHLGTIKGPTIGSHEFDRLVEQLVKKVRKQYPKADALLFDSVIRQTHNTRVSVIKFK